MPLTREAHIYSLFVPCRKMVSGIVALEMSGAAEIGDPRVKEWDEHTATSRAPQRLERMLLVAGSIVAWLWSIASIAMSL